MADGQFEITQEILDYAKRKSGLPLDDWKLGSVGLLEFIEMASTIGANLSHFLSLKHAKIYGKERTFFQQSKYYDIAFIKGQMRADIRPESKKVKIPEKSLDDLIDRLDLKSSENYLDLISKIEKIGIYVISENSYGLGWDGFTIYGKRYPFIYVNTSVKSKVNPTILHGLDAIRRKESKILNSSKFKKTASEIKNVRYDLEITCSPQLAAHINWAAKSSRITWTEAWKMAGMNGKDFEAYAEIHGFC